MFYTYAHYRPDNSVFYIGKGRGRRAWDKINRNKKWKSLVQELGTHRVQVLAYWESEQEAFEHEILLIECFKDMGVELVNISKGGFGSSGYRHREETRLRMKETRAGDKNAFFGRAHSEETKQKIAKAKKAKPSAFWLGQTRSEETKRKIAEALRGRAGHKHTEESKRKLSLSRMGKKQAPPSEETRKKLSESVKMSWALRRQKLKGH